MKILMLADGRAVHTIRYQEQLKEMGVELILASLERGDTVDIQLKKKSVSRSLSYALVNREIKELVRKLDPDIVNPHFASAYGFSVALSKIWQRKPVVLHCLGSDILISPRKSIAHRRRVMYALAKANLVFVDSKHVETTARRLRTIDKCMVIPWGVEPEILKIYDNKSEIDFTQKRPLQIFCPRPHTKVYNNLFIIEALEKIILKKEIVLTFSARGEDFEKFRKLTQKMFPDKTINFYDFKPRQEYLKILSDFDIYLSASYSDSSPASLIEAMGAGLYPVVADIPGVSDWIDKTNATLFNPDDKTSLYDAVNSLLNKLPSKKSILEKNYQKVVNNGVIENNIRCTIQAMEKLI